jgi:Protein of unknown function (DUF3293)
MSADQTEGTAPWDGYASSHIEIAWCGRPLLITPNDTGTPASIAQITPLAVVSACNPASIRRTARANHESTRQMKRRLIEMDVPHAEAVGYSACREWVEPSFALIGVHHRVIEALCREFGQIAYFAIDQSRVRVVDDAGVTRSSRVADIRPVPADASVLASARSWFEP